MRHFILAVVVGVLAAGLARADLIPPGTKNIPVENKVETDREHPDWVFLVARGSGGVTPVKLDPKTPVVIAGSAAIGNGPVGFKGPRPYRSSTLVAVPKDAVRP